MYIFSEGIFVKLPTRYWSIISPILFSFSRLLSPSYLLCTHLLPQWWPNPETPISFIISFSSLVEISLLGRIMSPLILLVAKTPWDFEVQETQGKNLSFLSISSMKSFGFCYFTMFMVYPWLVWWVMED